VLSGSCIGGAEEKCNFFCFARSEMMEGARMHGNFLLLFPITIIFIVMYFVFC